MRKQQQHVQSTLESFKIDFENIDISCPNNEEDKKFMRANSKTRDESTVPLPPQIFNEEEYCGVCIRGDNSLIFLMNIYMYTEINTIINLDRLLD